jgi:hypothetical protein
MAHVWRARRREGSVRQLGTADLTVILKLFAGWGASQSSRIDDGSLRLEATGLERAIARKAGCLWGQRPTSNSNFDPLLSFRSARNVQKTPETGCRRYGRMRDEWTYAEEEIELVAAQPVGAQKED